MKSAVVQADIEGKKTHKPQCTWNSKLPANLTLQLLASLAIETSALYPTTSQGRWWEPTMADFLNHKLRWSGKDVRQMPFSLIKILALENTIIMTNEEQLMTIFMTVKWPRTSILAKSFQSQINFRWLLNFDISPLKTLSFFRTEIYRYSGTVSSQLCVIFEWSHVKSHVVVKPINYRATK